ncbi:MAG TPA: iron chelate uptake ABC transporter family permease subunit, partial [Aquabacterium sp.]|nr:iron chelate uptake ABC transporter family permease subunit [Aquabacterium sp.]
MSRPWIWVLCVAVLLLLGGLGLGVGSTGWQSPWAMGAATSDPMAAEILWGIRAPRTVGAGLVGALLGLAGAVAQGLFRNPLAEPYLLGSSAGAGLCMAVLLTVGLPWMV